MGIQYDPKQADNCWPAGDYDAELLKVEDKISKRKADGSGGNPMQELRIKVFNDDGRSQLTSDYFTAAAAFKIKQLAKALGKEADFNAGTFQANDYVGAGFVVELAIEPSDEFGDRNKVKKYKAARTQAPEPTPAKAYPRNRETVLTERRPPSAPISDNEMAFKEEDIPF